MEQSFLKMYQEDGVFLTKPDEITLHQSCPDRLSCWINENNIKESGCDWNKIQKPYIGSEYKNILLAIGLNLNEYGGWSSLNNLFNGENENLGIIKYLSKGWKKINFGNQNYGGTFIYHRLAVYASIIIEDKICSDGNLVLSPNMINIYEDNIYLSNIMKKIAFVEAVKCSPWWEKSTPTDQMKFNCPKRFLVNEIQILKPQFIILFDKDIFFALKSTSKIENEYTMQYSNYCKMTINNQAYKIFYIIHPSAFGGNSRDVALDLFTLKQKIEND